MDRQEGDAGSLLNHYRRLLAWRRTQPALLHGEMELLPLHEQVFAFVRRHGSERVLCAFNLSERAAALTLPPGLALGAVLADSGARGAAVQGSRLDFDPWGVLFARLA